jgi:predicted metal-binding protein
MEITIVNEYHNCKILISLNITVVIMILHIFSSLKNCPLPMDIPLNTPICLKAHTGNNLQNEFFWRNGRCNNQNTEAWEKMMLIKTEDEKIIIQSRWNGRNLQVQESGQFANHNQELWEKFEVESDKDGKVYFISCHTGNVMQCNQDGFAWCVNKNRQSWEAWTIIYQKTLQ